MKTLSTLFLSIVLTTVASFAQTAEVQVIHNAADPAADSVDVYLNGTLTFNDFEFRSASNFATVPSGVPISIAVAPANSSSVADAIATFNYDSLENGNTYIIVANGVLSPGSFTANPDGESTGFDLYLYDMGRSSASMGMVDLLIFHGATDAPTVDIVARGVGTLADDITYGEFNSAGYVTVPAGKYIIDVYTADQSTLVTSYEVNIASAGGAAAVAFASGFLDASQGPGFGVLAATDIGAPAAAVFNFPALGNARVQVIHNAADPAADTVDIYTIQDGVEVKLEDVAFRSATPYMNVVAGKPLSIGVAPANSSSFTDTLVTFNYDSLMTGGTYVVVANGVLDPNSFTANPSGNSIGFNLYVNAGQEAAMMGTNVAVAVWHGATDAPAVDVASGAVTVFPNLEYGEWADYAELPAVAYVLDINAAGTTTTVVSYDADITSLAGGAGVAFASGFLDASQGEAFGIWVALADGTTFPLSVASGITEADFAKELNLFPNPAANSTTIRFSLENAQPMQVRMLNVAGQLVQVVDLGEVNSGTNAVTLNVNDLNSGMYLVQLVSATGEQINRTIIVE